MKLVVYTSVYGPVDYVPEFVGCTPSCDCFVITDSQDLLDYVKSYGGPFRGIPTPSCHRNPRKASRHAKTMPHLYFPGYELSVYIDANVRVYQDPMRCVPAAMSSTDYLIYPHVCGVASAYAEGERCLARRYGDPGDLRRQLRDYKTSGYVEDQDVIPQCWAIFRRHNVPAVVAAGEEWWHQIVTYCERDQISWPYVRWSQNLKFTWANAPGCRLPPGFVRRGPHVKRTT